MNIVLKLFLLIVSLVFVLISIAVIRTALLPEPPSPEPCTSKDEDYISDDRGLSKRLSEAVKFPTVSIEHHKYNEEALLKFVQYVKKSFPLVHSSPLVSREIVNNFSLLYHIQGSDTSLKPYMLAGHMDVVPVEEDSWDVPPFSGQIKDGFLYGRGTIDCKDVVMGSLEALEFLLSKGFKPRRSFYLAYGHDEEISGLDGAQHISNLLKSRNVILEYILDEGTFVFNNLVPQVKAPVALVGISEKGALDVKLTVHGRAGHSSAPFKETAIVTLAKALAKLEGDVFPSMFGRGPEREMLEELAYCSPFPMKVVLSNIWLFKPVIPLFMKSNIMSAIHRTTVAVTLVSGGSKINVLPNKASASVNLRVHPAQTIQEAVEYLKSIINDKRVEIEILSQMPPHPVSPIDTFGYLTLKKSILQIYNDSCVIPTTLIANTDTRWYLDLTKSIYRFSLARMNVSDVSRFHGHNERISVSNYVELVNFFMHIMKNSDLPHVPNKHNHEEL